MKQFTAVILAAGKGKRMKSPLPKVLHELRGKPLIYYVLKEVSSLRRYIKQIVVVVGHNASLVEKEIKKYFKNVEVVHQKSLLGTADAVKCAQQKVRHNNVLILCGDALLITQKTLSSFIAQHGKQEFSCSVVSAHVEGENSLGMVEDHVYLHDR